MMRFQKAAPRDQLAALGMGALICVPLAFVAALTASWLFPALTTGEFWATIFAAYFLLTFVVEPMIIRQRQAKRSR